MELVCMPSERQIKPRNRSHLAPYPTAKKVMAAYRMPEPLHEESLAEAKSMGLDFTTFMNRVVDGFLHYFMLPQVVAEVIDRDRAALGFGRLEYLQYLVFRRYEAVSKQGPGFDSPEAKGKR
jgi:hypothetical protein